MQHISVGRHRSAFTLIELLVVVLILAILMAVALPLYLNAVADSEKKVCRANMQTIANAVQASRVQDKATDYSPYAGVPTPSVLKDLVTIPICPSTGTYTVVVPGSTGGPYEVRCSKPSHGKFEPGIDST